ncbi:MAG: DUF2764 family protein [Bacteroidetes bacterium]|nr:DUF2764 family protein [Bacteroidota bacterium]
MQVKRNYYCLVAGLQDISIETHKLTFGQLEFKNELKTEVHPDDYKLIEKLFLPFDNKNILNLLTKSGKDFDEKGNLEISYLEEQIKETTDLPDYMSKFIASTKSGERIYADMAVEDELATLFYDEMLSHNNEFLRNWFEFDMNVRNIVTASMGRKHNIKYEHLIVGSTEISNIIRKSNARDFGLGSELDYIEELSSISKDDDIQEREMFVDELKWNYLEDVTFFEYFTIEKILAFIIKLGIVERWLAIDKEHGKELFKKLLDELRKSYKLPETFTEK